MAAGASATTGAFAGFELSLGAGDGVDVFAVTWAGVDDRATTGFAATGAAATRAGFTASATGFAAMGAGAATAGLISSVTTGFAATTGVDATDADAGTGVGASATTGFTAVGAAAAAGVALAGFGAVAGVAGPIVALVGFGAVADVSVDGRGNALAMDPEGRGKALAMDPEGRGKALAVDPEGRGNALATDAAGAGEAGFATAAFGVVAAGVVVFVGDDQLGTGPPVFAPGVALAAGAGFGCGAKFRTGVDDFASTEVRSGAALAVGVAVCRAGTTPKSMLVAPCAPGAGAAGVAELAAARASPPLAAAVGFALSAPSDVGSSVICAATVQRRDRQHEKPGEAEGAGSGKELVVHPSRPSRISVGTNTRHAVRA